MPEPLPPLSEPFRIDLSIPGQAQFLGVVRLAVAGLCHRLGLDLGEAGDLKMAVTEACNACLQVPDRPEALVLAFEVEPDQLVMSVRPSPPDDSPFSRGGASELALILLEALVDEVEVLQTPRGLRMTHYLVPRDLPD